MKISVIVPIYNVEYFIARCTVSLMEQTLQNVEYIFVDDCSPDNSISLLKKQLHLILIEYPMLKFFPINAMKDFLRQEIRDLK